MIENKRFTLHQFGLNFLIKDNGKELSAKQIVDLLNENEQLRKKNERITKYKENWAFISDCSVQVMNEEEKFKEDYLRIATNDLKKLQEENEQLKETNQELYDKLQVTMSRNSLNMGEIVLIKKENEQLKDILKDIIIQLDANHTMNTYQMIVPINKVIYNELNRRLKETSFNEELRRFLDD